MSSDPTQSKRRVGVTPSEGREGRGVNAGDFPKFGLMGCYSLPFQIPRKPWPQPSTWREEIPRNGANPRTPCFKELVGGTLLGFFYTVGKSRKRTPKP